MKFCFIYVLFLFHTILIYGSQNQRKIFAKFVSPFLETKDLIYFCNFCTSQKANFPILHLFPNSKNNKHLLIFNKGKDKAQVLFDLLPERMFERRVIIFDPQSKIASIPTQKFQGSVRYTLCSVYDQIVPFQDVYRHSNYKILIAKTQNRFAMFSLTFTMNVPEFLNICAGKYSSSGDSSKLILYETNSNENKKIIFPDDIEFLILAKRVTKVKHFVKGLFWYQHLVQKCGSYVLGFVNKLFKFFMAPHNFLRELSTPKLTLMIAMWYLFIYLSQSAFPEYSVVLDKLTYWISQGINGVTISVIAVLFIFSGFVLPALFPTIITLFPLIFILSKFQILIVMSFSPIIPFNVSLFLLAAFYLPIPKESSFPPLEQEMYSACALVLKEQKNIFQSLKFRIHMITSFFSIYFLFISMFIHYYFDWLTME